MDKQETDKKHKIKEGYLYRQLTLCGIEHKYTKMKLCGILATILTACIFTLIAIFNLPELMIVAFVLGLITGWSGFLLFIGRLAKLHQEKLAQQVMPTIEIMSNFLEENLSIANVFQRITETIAEPMRSEFKKALDSLMAGNGLTSVLAEMSCRIKALDFQVLTHAININLEIKGSLAETVATVDTAIREQATLKKHVHLLSKLLKLLAVFLLLLPWAILILTYLIQPSYSARIFHWPITQFCFVFLTLWELVGFSLLIKVGRLSSTPISLLIKKQHPFLLWFKSLFLAFFKSIGQWTLNLMPSLFDKKSTELLGKVTYRQPADRAIFIGIKYSLLLALVILYLITAVHSQIPPLICLLALLCSWYLPNIYLDWRAKKRQALIQKELPIALNLLMVCAQAKLDLSKSLETVGKETKNICPILSAELNELITNINVIKPISGALQEMGERCGVAELASLGNLLAEIKENTNFIRPALRHEFKYIVQQLKKQASKEATVSLIKILAIFIVFILPLILLFLLAPAMYSYRTLAM